MNSIRPETINYINKIINSDKQSQVIENSIYNHIQKNYHYEEDSLDFQTEYKFKARSILYNLKHLKPKIKDKSLPFDLKDIASQSKISLRPERWATHIKLSELNRQRNNTKEQETTDQFKCAKCNQNKTTYFLRQTRSIDEPETVFITCINCGNKWRQNG